MGIKSELEEAKALWSSSSIILRLVICLSLFFTISAVTSLADQVFAWKGFILDGVLFYRAYISRPIIYLAKEICLNFSTIVTDYLVIATILYFSICRAYLMESLREVNWPLSILICLFGYALMLLNQSVKDTPNISYGLLLVIYVFMPFILEADKKFKWLWYGPLVFALSILLILGAINAGLTR